MQKRKTVFDVFNDEFESRMASAPTYKKAYDDTADSWHESYGFDAYSGYDSFRMTRKYNLKKKKKG